MLKKLYFDSLGKVEINDMLGSESILCNCFYNGRRYLYKQPNSFNENTISKLEEMMKITELLMSIFFCTKKGK